MYCPNNAATFLIYKHKEKYTKAHLLMKSVMFLTIILYMLILSYKVVQAAALNVQFNFCVRVLIDKLSHQHVVRIIA